MSEQPIQYKFRIDNHEDRIAIATALLNAGYGVRIVKEKDTEYPYPGSAYYVHVTELMGDA